MREHLSAAFRTGERVVDACDRPSVYATGTLLTAGIGVVLGMAGKGEPFGVFIYGAMMLAVYGFLRYGWPPIQRFHERREPDERDPTSIRFEGFSADVGVFLTLVAAVTVFVFGLILVELYLA